MASLIASATAFAAHLAEAGSRFADETRLIRHINHNRVGPAPPPPWMREKFEISSKTLLDRKVYTVAPRSSQAGGRIIYLHGGGYVEPILSWHWKFIARLAQKLGLPFTVPMYPLAPEHDCASTIAFMLGLYRDQVLSNSGPFVFMGDSSGGGLATSLAMQAASAGLPKPSALVLISPWLDVTMSHPTQAEIERFDPLLRLSGARLAGRWYAGRLATTDPRVSPIYGDIAPLPPILMFSGTRDILVTDARRLAARAQAEHSPVEYVEEVGLIHGYPLLFFPESRIARGKIVQFVCSRLADSRSAPLRQSLTVGRDALVGAQARPIVTRTPSPGSLLPIS